MLHPHLRTRPPSLRSRIVGAVALVVTAAVVLGACSNSSSRALVGTTTTTEAPAPPTADDQSAGLQPPPGFKVPDTRNAVLLAAPTKAKPAPIPVVGGKTTIRGTVTGPDGPVAGATVEIERFVGTASGSVQVGTDGGGRFVLPDALGGRYRVRAWLQPDLSTFSSPTGFVAADDTLALDVTLERHNAVTLQLASSEATLSMVAPGGVRALLSRETVGSDGIVRSAGLGGSAITLVAADGITITSANPATTDATGSASWVVTCTAEGAHQVSAATADGSASASVTLPSCTTAAPTTTTSPTTTTTRAGATTTTTRPGGPGSVGPGR